MLHKQRSHDERQGRTRVCLVAASLNASFSVSVSWQTRQYREKSFSVQWSSRLRAGSLKTRHVTRSLRQCELAFV